MIDRKFGIQVNKALEYFPCVTLTDARQTGKTTLLRSLLPEYNYVSLDLPSIAALADETPEIFLKNTKVLLLLMKFSMLLNFSGF